MWFYEAVVLLFELFLVLSSSCSLVSFFAVLYITGEPSEAALGITWGLSFASSFRPSAVSGPFFHFQFCLIILSLERNENLITGGLITTFSVFEVCFEKPMQIYHWRHSILNKYLSLCYIPVLYVLSSVIGKEVLLFEWQKILRTCSEMSYLIASWPKCSISFYLLVSRDSGVLMKSLLQKAVLGQVFYLRLKDGIFSLCFSHQGLWVLNMDEVLFVSLCLFSAVCTEGLSSPQPPNVPLFKAV